MTYSAGKAAPYAALMAESFRRWTGRDIRDNGRADKALPLAEALYTMPCPLVSHGVEADPVFRYANLAAQELWALDWDAFTRMPSRFSAAPEAEIQDDRQRLLRAALEKGWIDNYTGTRRASTGALFDIVDTVLWNVVDANGVRHGQAALIKDWKSR